MSQDRKLTIVDPPKVVEIPRCVLCGSKGTETDLELALPSELRVQLIARGIFCVPCKERIPGVLRSLASSPMVMTVVKVAMGSFAGLN